MKLSSLIVRKPWGSRALPPPFDVIANDAADPVGEIWFDAVGADAPPALLVKYIFTDEKLSVQVHPNDAQGRARGLAGGKSECWYILDAQPGATLGLGVRAAMDADALRAAALDGSIEGMMDWKPVTPGDFFFVPAGTIHAIGAGISLVEIQQNVDVTYRLYDYGRPRELHLDDGVAVSVHCPYDMTLARHVDAAQMGEVILADCPQFTALFTDDLAATRARMTGRQLWVAPLAGVARSGKDVALPGECLWLDGDACLSGEPGTRALVGAGA